jgi:hypothetical protein
MKNTLVPDDKNISYLETEKKEQLNEYIQLWVVDYLKNKIKNLLNLSKFNDTSETLVNIGIWDKIQLKKQNVNSQHVLWRVLWITSKKNINWKTQIVYQLELYRAKEFSYINIQDIFNWNIKLSKEEQDLNYVNEKFEKIDFKED